MKNHTLNNFLGAHFEPEFYQLLETMDKDKNVRALALDGEETILGFGTAVPVAHYLQTHRAIIDFLVYPNYAAQSSELLSRLESVTNRERLTAFVGASEAERMGLLQEHGYRPARNWPAFLRDEERCYDLVEYEKVR